MMKFYKIILGLSFILATLSIGPGCRQNYVPTDDELADYGWVLLAREIMSVPGTGSSFP